MNEQNIRTVHLTVKGKVQGVFYRVSAKKAAEQLGITGWVKNTAAGDVEIMASGEQGALNQFIDWCKEGPSEAHVTEVVTVSQDVGRFSKFTIER
ncbi:MAG TPA: acylphosphatase [Flavisolibacter sp.]|nr:acylphosphatase [Flavisolibacter sp.]